MPTNKLAQLKENSENGDDFQAQCNKLWNAILKSCVIIWRRRKKKHLENGRAIQVFFVWFIFTAARAAWTNEYSSN